MISVLCKSIMLKVEVLVFAALFAGVYSQVVYFGSCPQVDVVKDFDASKYVGLWYEIERYLVIWEAFGKCVTAKYTANNDSTIGVHNEQVNSILGFGQAIDGTAYFDGPPNEAKLTVEFPVLGLRMRGSYWVLGTDYENWAVVYSCAQYGNFHYTTSWILARQAIPSEEILNQAYEIIEKNKIERRFYRPTDQVNCLKQ